MAFAITQVLMHFVAEPIHGIAVTFCTTRVWKAIVMGVTKVAYECGIFHQNVTSYNKAGARLRLSYDQS